MSDEALLNTDQSFSRFNDVYFKYLFASEKHQHFLADFINAVFDDKRPSCVRGRVNKIVLKDSELNSSTGIGQIGRLNFLAETDSKVIDIELRTYSDTVPGAEELFSFSNLYKTQIPEHYRYDKLRPVVIISLLADNVFEDRDCYHSCYELLERNERDLLSEKISIHFIEAQKCSRLSGENANRLIKWMKYLTLSSSSEVIEMVREDPVFTEVLQAEKMFVSNEEEMAGYRAQQRIDMYLASRIATAEDRGRELGEDVGQVLGKYIGECAGRAEKTAEIVLKMLDAGSSIDFIKEVTKLSEEEIADMQNTRQRALRD